MNIRQNADGSWSIEIDDFSVAPGSTPTPEPVLTLPAGTTAHDGWAQLLAFCAQRGIRIVPQLVLINPSGTTGTVIS